MEGESEKQVDLNCYNDSNALTTKSVLLLGRFIAERKAVLDALRDTLRQHNDLPMLFDCDPSNLQTVRETVRTLAHLSHFIIADLTNPSSIPEELETIIPTLAVPIQPSEAFLSLEQTTCNRVQMRIYSVRGTSQEVAVGKQVPLFMR